MNDALACRPEAGTRSKPPFGKSADPAVGLGRSRLGSETPWDDLHRVPFLLTRTFTNAARFSHCRQPVADDNGELPIMAEQPAPAGGQRISIAGDGSAGLLASFVGFASSFAVIIQGMTGVGASQAEAASGLMALSIAMGLCAHRPQPENAPADQHRLVDAGCGPPGRDCRCRKADFATAVGAFLVIAALLIVIAGLWKPLGRAVAAIPAPLANAMLAGVLLGLCLAPVKAVAAGAGLRPCHRR